MTENQDVQNSLGSDQVPLESGSLGDGVQPNQLHPPAERRDSGDIRALGLAGRIQLVWGRHSQIIVDSNRILDWQPSAAQSAGESNSQTKGSAKQGDSAVSRIRNWYRRLSEVNDSIRYARKIFESYRRGSLSFPGMWKSASPLSIDDNRFGWYEMQVTLLCLYLAKADRPQSPPSSNGGQLSEE